MQALPIELQHRIIAHMSDHNRRGLMSVSRHYRNTVGNYEFQHMTPASRALWDGLQRIMTTDRSQYVYGNVCLWVSWEDSTTDHDTRITLDGTRLRPKLRIHRSGGGTPDVMVKTVKDAWLHIMRRPLQLELVLMRGLRKPGQIEEHYFYTDWGI